jgi:hypothetical protein
MTQGKNGSANDAHGRRDTKKGRIEHKEEQKRPAYVCDYIRLSRSSHESVLGAMPDSPACLSLLLTFSFSSYCVYDDRYNERKDLYSILMFLLVIHQSLQLND